MEINNLSTQLNGQIDGAKANEARAAQQVPEKTESGNLSDKVSISKEGIQSTEDQFARIELEKANSAAFSKLKQYKARIQEYDQARQVSPEAAKETELGKMLNDPAVWEKMAENMFR
ncbi:MAG: hypothetical protein JJ895_08335 [Balneolaceae bacterium]|nr:hypothetical protein [Balneolaceae bacterium]